MVWRKTLSCKFIFDVFFIGVLGLEGVIIKAKGNEVRYFVNVSANTVPVIITARN